MIPRNKAQKRRFFYAHWTCACRYPAICHVATINHL